MPVIRLMSLPPKSGAGAGLACVTRFVSNPDEKIMAKKSTPTIAPIDRTLAKYFRDDEPGFCVFMLIPFLLSMRTGRPLRSVLDKVETGGWESVDDG